MENIIDDKFDGSRPFDHYIEDEEWHEEPFHLNTFSHWNEDYENERKREEDLYESSIFRYEPKDY